MSVLGYLAYLAAAKFLPLGSVVASRETSVLFGALIGTLLLREGFGFRRIAAAALVASGIALLGFGRSQFAEGGVLNHSYEVINGQIQP